LPPTIIDVNGQKVAIAEQGAPCSFAVSPTALSVPAGGATVTVAVQAQAACAWTVAGNDAWVVVRTASGTGNATVQLTIAANGGDARTGSVTVAGQAVTVNQAGVSAPPPPTPPPTPVPPPPTPPPPSCSYSLSPTSQSIGAGGGTGSVGVTAGAGCGWKATSNDPWIIVTAGVSGSGSGTFAFSVAPNTGAARTGTIAVANQTFTVQQDAAAAPPPPPPACSYSVSPGSQRVDANGGQVSFTVSTTSACAWTAVPGNSWLTIASGASGTGNGSVVVNVAPNSGGSRDGSVTIAGQSVNVRQGGADATASGPVALLTGACPTLQFSVQVTRVSTDASTTFRKGPCKSLADGTMVSVQGSVQSDSSLLAADVAIEGKV
jgi:hypothetical protein